jgi:AcrR family transcriptional regulator
MSTRLEDRATGGRSLPSARKPISTVKAPKRLLAPETERSLTTRQLEILDALEDSVMVESLAGVTMAEIAKRMNCSLRTLYGIAPSKDELVMAVVDRRLHRIGREAIAALDLEGSPLTRLRAYLRAANRAVQPTTAAFSRDFARDPAAQRVVGAHGNYVIAITQALLDEAVVAGEIPAMDTIALAHILGGLGSEFSRPEVEDEIVGSPKDAADFVAEIIFAGLSRGPD